MLINIWSNLDVVQITCLIIGNHTQGLGIIPCLAVEGIQTHMVNDLVIFLSRFCRYLKRYHVLKSGYSVQIIDMGDHYHYLDKTNTHTKEYLKFSDRLWMLYFENTIFYMNRVQSSEWIELFENAGLRLVHKQKLYVDIDSLRISNEYKKLTSDDLERHQLIVVHQKPTN